MIFAPDFNKNFFKNGLTPEIIQSFQKMILDYYNSHERNLPWRNEKDPYKIFISEMMLQQTQAERVVEKYFQFIQKYPDFKSLSESSLQEVLKLWKGLGYNRRAIWMKEAAKIIFIDYSGKLPSDPSTLEKLKGIGHATAREMITFSYNIPTVFIETNIRRVFIYFFFNQKSPVNDSEIISLVEKTVYKENPREWYYALMDYGVMLKKKFPSKNPNKKSKGYRKQAPFKGSNRELRGKILDIILKNPGIELENIINRIKFLNKELTIRTLSEKIKNNIMKLEEEGFIVNIDGKLKVSN